MTRLRTRKAFTLVELIVVVIIVAILAIAAAVAYNQFIANAEKSAVQADAVSSAKALNANAAADTIANGNAATYTKNRSSVAVVSAATGVPTARLLAAHNSANLLTDAQVQAFVPGASFWVGQTAHACLVTFDTSTATAQAKVSSCD